MVVPESHRICIECGERIAGRTDKKYCTDQCRTAWHNKHHSESVYMRTVNNILRRNRKILADLAARGVRKVGSAALMKLGFEFGYFTNMKRSRNGVLAHYCYEQGYTALTRGTVLLLDRPP